MRLTIRSCMPFAPPICRLARMSGPRFLTALAAAAILMAPSVSLSAEPRYITQTYIDTTIQQALYFLTAAADEAEIGLTMKAAIDRAKQVAARLRKIAETDPNKQYILFKVGELESQIYLEEMGLFQESATQRQQSSNQLVARFNSAIAARRPDFAGLEQTVSQTAAVDPARANDMEAALYDRKKNIGREVLAAIDAAFDDGAFGPARSELAYLSANRQYLGMTMADYARLEGRFQANVSVADELAYVDGASRQADSLLRTLVLDAARLRLDGVSSRLTVIKARTQQREWDERFFRNKRQVKALEKKEDSLVTANLSILKTKGVYEASEYLEKQLKKRGVAFEKVSSVNQAITELALSERARDDTAGGISGELAALTEDSDNNLSLLGELRLAAKTKAVGNRQGPLPAREGERVSRVEQLRRTSLQTSQAIESERDAQRTKENLERAQQEILMVYTLLEKGQISEAFAQFEYIQKHLKDLIPPNELKALDSAMVKQTRQKK